MTDHGAKLLLFLSIYAFIKPSNIIVVLILISIFLLLGLSSWIGSIGTNSVQNANLDRSRKAEPKIRSLSLLSLNMECLKCKNRNVGQSLLRISAKIFVTS